MLHGLDYYCVVSPFYHNDQRRNKTNQLKHFEFKNQQQPVDDCMIHVPPLFPNSQSFAFQKAKSGLSQKTVIWYFVHVRAEAPYIFSVVFFSSSFRFYCWICKWSFMNKWPFTALCGRTCLIEIWAIIFSSFLLHCTILALSCVCCFWCHSGVSMSYFCIS